MAPASFERLGLAMVERSVRAPDPGGRSATIGPPLQWARLGIAIAAAGYAIEAVHSCIFMGAAAADWLQEATVAGVSLAALAVVTRRPRLAVLLTLGAVWSEIMVSLAQTGRVFSTSILAIPALVAAAAVSLPSVEAYVVTVVSAVAVPAVVYGSRWARGDMSPIAPHPDEGHWLLTAELALFATTLIVRATVQSHGRALIASERERRRYTDLFERAPDGLLALDEAGRIVEANAAAGRLLGVDPDGLTGALIRDAFARAGAKGDVDLANLRTEDLVSIDLAGNEGRTQTLEISTWVERDVASSLTLLAIRDVTERRMLEERLRHAQRLETVGQLAGGVAHDFNNLLTAVGGNAEVLQRHGDPAVRDSAGEILKAYERSAALTRQLLAFGRRDIRQPAPMDVGEVVAGVARLLERVLGEQHPLVVSRDANVCVVADRGQIEQVALNLATNARDAMPEGGRVELAVRALARSDAQMLGSQLSAERQAMLEVRDDGAGMTPEVRAHIFEPFFTTKPRGQGTGLGLSTVHGIVGQSGGQIAVESAPGDGSCFRVFLPLATGAPATPQPPAASTSPGGSERVLVVEDDGEVATLARRVLSQAGYDVTVASNAEQAMLTLLAQSGEIDLLLADVVMPGLSGTDLAEALRARQPGLRVLYVSGYFDGASSRGNIAADAVLHKPFTTDTLLLRVRSAIDAASSASGQARTP
jgi:two-component system, cell cycle sensor histidine kinase and response regulator CckA